MGAAIGAAPNGTLVFSRLGVDPNRAKPTALKYWHTMDGISLKDLKVVDMSANPMTSFHRVDLHSELLRLALGDEPSILHLDSPVKTVDSEDGIVELEDGSRHQVDLVVGADGLRSAVRAAVIKGPDPLRTSLNSLRFLVPSEKVLADPELRELWSKKEDYATGVFDTNDLQSGRHFVWYGCRR